MPRTIIGVCFPALQAILCLVLVVSDDRAQRLSTWPPGGVNVAAWPFDHLPAWLAISRSMSSALMVDDGESAIYAASDGGFIGCDAGCHSLKRLHLIDGDTVPLSNLLLWTSNIPETPL